MLLPTPKSFNTGFISADNYLSTKNWSLSAIFLTNVLLNLAAWLLQSSAACIAVALSSTCTGKGLIGPLWNCLEAYHSRWVTANLPSHDGNNPLHYYPALRFIECCHPLYCIWGSTRWRFLICFFNCLHRVGYLTVHISSKLHLFWSFSSKAKFCFSTLLMRYILSRWEWLNQLWNCK